MALDRAQLITDATGYMHRSDLPYDTFIDRANNRVGQDFRTTANRQTATLTSGAQYLLPSDFKEMSRVTAQGPGGTYALQAIGGSQAADYNSAGGGYPYGYYLIGGYLVPTPATTLNIDIGYYTALVLATGATSTNLLLQTYYSAYLWYILMQCHLYIGASEESVNYLNLYLDEKDRANAVNRQKQQPNSSVVGTTGIVVTAT